MMTAAIISYPPVRHRARPSREDRLARCLGPIEHRAIDTLRRYDENPRKHSKAQITKLVASIREFGFVAPVLISLEGEIIAGDARVRAAREVGLATVPTICAEHLSSEQVRAYRIADNKLAEDGVWDLTLLASEFRLLRANGSIDETVTGYDTGAIDVILLDEPGSEDAAGAVTVPAAIAVTRPGDLWLLGRHRLLCGSSLDKDVWSHVMDGRQARMCFTDPPYNVPISGFVGGSGAARHSDFAMASGEMDEPQFTAFLTESLERQCFHLIDGAVLYLCMDWRHLYELQAAARATGLSQLNLCVWDKGLGGMGGIYRSQHELVLVCKKGSGRHINNVGLGKHGRNRCNIWRHLGANGFGKDRLADLAAHPTVKPVAMVADAILDVTRPGDIVIDGFSGSGTTILAAEKTGRIGHGIEIEPTYVDVAVRRWQEMTGESAILAETGETYAAVAAGRSEGGALGVR